MKSPNKEKNERFASLPIWTHRNGQLMLLLSLVTDFQKDIMETREKRGIPPGGYSRDYTNCKTENDYREAREKHYDQVEKKIIELGGYFTENPVQFLGENATRAVRVPSRKVGQETIPSHDVQLPSGPTVLQIDVRAIGEKFTLPFHFYNSSFHGLAHYILTNDILTPPKNWTIERDVEHTKRGLPVQWVGIRAYVPLDEKELKEAVSEMNAVFESKFPKPIRKKSKTGPDKTAQLLEIAKLIEERMREDTDIGRYVKGSYLDRHFKSKEGKSTSEKERRALERKHPGNLATKEIRAKKSRERTMLNRANDLARELFNEHGITGP